MCGRCTRRDAGTSSLLETASVSNMRTSWVREGQPCVVSQTRLSTFPLSERDTELDFTLLTEPEHSLDFLCCHAVENKNIHVEFRYTKNHFKTMIKMNNWTFGVCASKYSSLLPKNSHLPRRLFYANSSFDSDSHCLFTCLTPTCCTICCV